MKLPRKILGIAIFTSTVLLFQNCANEFKSLGMDGSDILGSSGRSNKNGENETVIFSQPYLTSAASVVAANPNIQQLPDRMIMTSFVLHHYTPGEKYATPLTAWNMGAYTGTQSPASLSLTQIGLSNSNSVPGGTAFQVAGDTVGIINSPHLYTTQMNNIPGDLIFPVHPIQVHYETSDKRIRPFTDGGHSLNMNFDVVMPVATAYGTNGIGYMGATYTLRDVTTGTTIYIGTQIMDNRGTAKESMVIDSCDKCSGNIIVGTVMKPGMKYSTLHTNSGQFQGQGWNNFQYYGWTLRKDHFVSIMNDVLKEYPNRKLSPDPANYELVGFHLGTEVVLPSRKDKYTMGTSVRNYKVSVEGKTIVRAPAEDPTPVKSVVGFFDGVQPNNAIQGWACVKGSTESLKVRIKADNAVIAEVATNVYADLPILNRCNTTAGNFRFRYLLSSQMMATHQNKTLRAFVVDGSQEILLDTMGVQPYQVPVPDSAPSAPVYNPVAGTFTGVFEGIVKTNYLEGWSCLKGNTNAVLVRVKANGVIIKEVVANVSSEPQVAANCGTQGRNYRFSVALTAQEMIYYRGQNLEAFAMNAHLENKLQTSTLYTYQIR